jgi:hypothetical protein
MSIRHYPRNKQSRLGKVLNGSSGQVQPRGTGVRNVQSAHDGFLAIRPDVDTTQVASTVWGY